MKQTRFTKNQKKVRTLAEVAILLALATVLSIFKLYQLPYGGAFTLASMFPIILISYRHGAMVGMASGLIYGVLQQLLSLSYIQGMTLFSAIMVILLDYALAFAVIGISGLFRGICKNQSNAFIFGSLFACIARYTCHVIAGCTVWAGLSIPTKAAFWYSLLYNAAFMIPETVITVAAAYYLSSCIDFNLELPVRVKNEGGSLPISSIAGGLILTAGLIADTIILFSHTQKESGEFDITLISTLSKENWITIGIIGAVSVIAFVISRLFAKNKNKTQP